MTDAKGLSSTDLIEWLRDPDLLDGARQHYLDALAERLKAMTDAYMQFVAFKQREELRADKAEAERDELKERLNKAENELCTAKDQLPPDETDLSVGLIKLKDRLKACEARLHDPIYEECCELRNKAEDALAACKKELGEADDCSQHWHDKAILFHRQRAQLTADLERARAEVERWKERANDNGTEATKLEQSNGRLKAAWIDDLQYAIEALDVLDVHGDRSDKERRARRAQLLLRQAALTETP